MTSKYIKRKWTDHAQSTEYLSDEDEYIKLEIFSFDPKFTKRFSVEQNTLVGENCTRTNYESLPCFKSKDKINLMEFTLNYKVTENGEYRVDFLYMKHNQMYNDEKDKLYNTSKDLTGWYDIYKANVKSEHNAQILTSLPKNASNAVKKAFEKTQKAQIANANNSNTERPDSSVPLKFEGENNILKRKTIFKRLDKGDWKFEFAVPHNCYVVGAIIRKIKYFSGTNNDEPGSNLQFTHAKTTNSEMGKPVELEATIGYDNAFDCAEHRSNLYMEHMDECNVYVKDSEDNLIQWFGGYIATPLVDKDMREITIHATDRLKDGENKYILDELYLQKGDGSDSQNTRIINFNRYSDLLKYLCRLYECTLKNNITKNFQKDVEKYQGSFMIGYGKKRDVKKIPVTNGQVTINKNSVTLRNNANSSKKQVFTIYNTKKPINLSSYGNEAKPVNLHITYGLGDVKTDKKIKDTITVDVGGETAGSQQFGKCGVSKDKKFVMGIGQRTVGRGASSYPYGTYFESIFENKCPDCGKATLRWDSCRSDTKCIFNHGRSGSKRNWGKGIPANETEITCENCDCDFDVPTGYSKEGKYKYRLKKVGSTKKSSKSRQDKLHKGEMVASAGKSVNITKDDIFKAIANACKGWKHQTGTGTTANYLEKHHKGDCWAWSDWISKKLKHYKVNNMILQEKNGTHRSVVYQNSKGNYVSFPYREYGLPQGTYDTKGSRNGSKVSKYTSGGRINQATSSGSNTKTETKEITVTKGYDKDKPFQAYLDIKFSFGKTGKKHHVYVDFTQSAKSNYAISGAKPVWINNAATELTVKGIVKKMQEWYNNHTDDVYLHSLSFITPKVKSKAGDKNTEWYTNDDNTKDNSSCKIILYSVSFDNQDGTDSSPLNTTGKTVNELMKTVISDANYIMNIDYSTHRVNDLINFNINSDNNPVFTATEGDNNNILEWGNISYDPANAMFNMSRCVYMSNKTGMYAYVSSKDLNSILEFQEQCTLLTENDPIGAKEAYWNARHNEKFNPEIVYNYTITVRGVANVNLKDLVQVVSDNKQLNTLKEVESVSLEYDYRNKPVIQTELGLGELAPDIQVRTNIKKLRDSAKKNTTYFYGTADPVHDEDIYEWEY